MDEKNDKRVTSTGNGTIKKPTAWDKFRNRLFKEDMSTIGDKIIDDAIIPSIKRVISDTIDMILYGERRNSSPINTFGVSRIGNMISYNSIFDSGKKKKEMQPAPIIGQSLDIGSIIVANKQEAEKCIAQMMEIEGRYGNVRATDLCDYFEEALPHTYNNYGWRNFASSKVKELGDGRCLVIPPQLELLQSN